MPNLMRLKFLSSEVIIHALALVCILLTVEGKQLIYGNGSGTRCGGSKGIGSSPTRKLAKPIQNKAS